MLQSLLEEQRILIHPGHIGMARVNRLLRGRGQSLETLAMPEWEGGQSWHAGLKRLAGKIGEPTQTGKRPLQYLVSSSCVRHLLLPWRDELEGEREWQAYAAHAMTTTFGGVSSEWQVRVAPQHFGQPVLAAAIPENLAATLAEAAAQSGRRVAGMSTFLVELLNRRRSDFGETDFWCFVVEPGKITALRAEQSVWVHLVTYPLGTDWQADALRTMERELARQNRASDGNALFVHAPFPLPVAPESFAGHRVIPLWEEGVRASASIGDALARMALC